MHRARYDVIPFKKRDIGNNLTATMLLCVMRVKPVPSIICNTQSEIHCQNQNPANDHGYQTRTNHIMLSDCSDAPTVFSLLRFTFIGFELNSATTESESGAG